MAATYLAFTVWFYGMKTTINLRDELLREAKRAAADRGVTLTSVIEDALRTALSSPLRTEKFHLGLPTIKGNSTPVVDISDREALFEHMEGRG